MGLWFNPYTGELKWISSPGEAIKAMKEHWEFVASKHICLYYKFYSLKDKDGNYKVVSIPIDSRLNECISSFKSIEEWNTFIKKISLVSQVCWKWDDRFRALRDPGYLCKRIERYLKQKKKLDLEILDLLPESKHKDHLLRLAIALQI